VQYKKVWRTVMANDWSKPKRFLVLVLPALWLAAASSPLYPVDRGEAMSLANYALALIRVNDVDGLLEIMDEDLKKDFLPFTPEKRNNFLAQVQKESQWIGDAEKILEIRACTTPSGKQGIAAKIRKQKKEIFVLMINLKDGIYYYESIYALDVKAYKNLTLIKKAE